MFRFMRVILTVLFILLVGAFIEALLYWGGTHATQFLIHTLAWKGFAGAFAFSFAILLDIVLIIVGIGVFLGVMGALRQIAEDL